MCVNTAVAPSVFVSSVLLLEFESGDTQSSVNMLSVKLELFDQVIAIVPNAPAVAVGEPGTPGEA